MDALSIRARGKRAAPKRQSGAPFNIGASIGLASTGRPGEFKLNGDQMEALESLYTSSPAITAARSVLRGQLFGGGIVLRRNGEDVKLKADFQRYLSSKWLGFAGDVLDSLLKWGLCVVVFDEDLDLKRRASRAAVRGAKPEAVLAPLVPPRETIEIAYRQGGLMGYTRQYVCFNMTSPQHATKVDENARVFIREQPDAVGNVISPMSKVFELGSFVTALTELALTSEITNARPRYAALDVARHACYNLTPPAPRAGCGRRWPRRTRARASRPTNSSLTGLPDTSHARRYAKLTT